MKQSAIRLGGRGNHTMRHFAIFQHFTVTSPNGWARVGTARGYNAQDAQDNWERTRNYPGASFYAVHISQAAEFIATAGEVS